MGVFRLEINPLTVICAMFLTGENVYFEHPLPSATQSTNFTGTPDVLIRLTISII